MFGDTNLLRVKSVISVILSVNVSSIHSLSSVSFHESRKAGRLVAGIVWKRLNTPLRKLLTKPTITSAKSASTTQQPHWLYQKRKPRSLLQ